MMKSRFYVHAWVVIAVMLFATGSVRGEDKKKEAKTLLRPHAKIVLDDGDTMVFLGDSITHQCLYTQYVEDFFYTRYPKKRIHFHNSGIGGDRAAHALLRFDEDVASYKPKYVTILLGMNDGSYTRFEQKLFDTYERDMTKLLDRLAEINTVAVPVTPSMFDSRAKKIRPDKRGPNELRDNYYNGVLAFYGAWLREQSQRRGLGFVDMYGPLNQITFQQRKTDPNFTLINDAVHPGRDGQVVMAVAILDDMHRMGRVSSVHAQRDGKTWKVKAQNGTVSDVLSGDRIGFTLTANSLPWVLPKDAKLGYKLTKAGHRLSNERLRVSGLESGNYELRIDGQPVGVYSDLQLGFKIELQENAKTPQHQQALKVAMLNKERNEKAVRPIRTLWLTRKRKYYSLESQLRANPKNPKLAEKRAEFEKWKADFDAQTAKLKTLANSYEEKIYAANQPQPHKYELILQKQAARTKKGK